LADQDLLIETGPWAPFFIARQTLSMMMQTSTLPVRLCANQQAFLRFRNRGMRLTAASVGRPQRANFCDNSHKV
jgi:hypothetical protein